MLKGFRIVAIGAILFATTSAIFLAQAGAGSPAVEPSAQTAKQILGCGPGEGVFALHAERAVGSEFESPRAAIAGILVGTDFKVSANEFVGKDVTIEGQGAKEFKVPRSAGKSSGFVTWIVPFGEGWVADGMYGCTTVAP